MSFRFQFRRGTTAERDAANPILAAGEPAVVLDSGQPAELVLGDGVTAMADLRTAVWDDDARLALAGTATQPGDLGTAAAADVADLATAAQGVKADTAVQPAALHAHSNKAALDLVSGTNTGDQVLPTWSTISGKPALVAEGATQADARTAIGAGTSSFSGAYADLSGKPTLGTAAATAATAYATAAQGAKADTAVQPAHALAYTVDVDVNEAVAMIGQTPVPITTYAGSPHSIVHPSLLFFPEKWNGWRYWMAYTPYNNGDYQWENPCIAVSNDGESWSVPVGLINPIDPYPGVGIGYNADPCLCMTADGSTMLMVWKRNSFTKQTVMATSTDGVTWSPRQVLFENAFEDVSPALLWDGTGYRMWTVKHDDTPNTLYLRTAAAPEGPWSAPVACTVSLPPGPGLWHMDIKRIGQQYHMVMASVDEGTGFNNHLWFGKSNDGLTWTFGKQPLMDTMSVPQDGYYKAGLVPKMTPDGISYEMWYSAIQGFTLMRTTVTFDRSKRRRDINNGILAAVAGLSPWVFADNFNRADTTAGIGTATTGQAWSSVLGNVMGIASGRAYVPVAGNSRSIVEIGVSDFRAGITFHTLGSSGYLMFRYVDATNLWRVGHGSGVLVFQKIVSGVLTTIPTAGRVRAGDRVEVECRGSLIRLFLNGLQVFEATDAALSTGTKLGLNIDNTTTRVDDVTARTL